MTDEAYRYRRLYEAVVEHIEALNDWAAQRGFVLPDTDTAGSEVAGWVVVSTTDKGSWVEYSVVFGSIADAQERRGTFAEFVTSSPNVVGARCAALVLLPEEA